MIEPREPDPRRAKLVELLGYAQRRLDRAEERRRRANVEHVDAIDGVVRAQAEIDAWDEAHPDPQMALI
jgi:hypothetical protein